jgi:hypothetical protein
MIKSLTTTLRRGLHGICLLHEVTDAGDVSRLGTEVMDVLGQGCQRRCEKVGCYMRLCFYLAYLNTSHVTPGSVMGCQMSCAGSPKYG